MTGGSILSIGILRCDVNLQFCGPVLFGHGESSPTICVGVPSLRPALGVRDMQAVKFTNSRRECSLGGHRGFPSAEKSK